MRFRLRTLMIVVAIGPPVLAMALYEAAYVVVRMQPTHCGKLVESGEEYMSGPVEFPDP